MKQKIFLFIATFCIALVKNEDYDNSEEELPEYPVDTGVPYPGDDFPKAVFLSDDSPLWGNDERIPSCFQNCYLKKKESHKKAIDEFSQQLLDATKQTLEEVRKELYTEEDFKTLDQKIQASAKKFGDSLKEYQEQFSNLVQEGSSDKIQNHIKVYEDKINESEMALDGDILNLKAMTIKKENLKEIGKNYEKTRNIKLTTLTNECKELMNSLKECMEKENCII